MLVMGRNHKLYYEAYNDASDLDGDKVLDIRYKPGIDYYGYFDSYKCYSYVSSRFQPVSVTSDKRCTGADGAYWSGDFLNYLTMSRMDALRRVLYGGKRSTDGSNTTGSSAILERAYIPKDGHSWGKEYYNIATDGYDIEDYTPLSQPVGGTRHWFVSTTLSDGGAPLLRVLENTVYRVWQWVSKEVPVISDKVQIGSDYTSRTVTDNNVSGGITDVTDGGAAGTITGSGNPPGGGGATDATAPGGTIASDAGPSPATEQNIKAFDNSINTKWLSQYEPDPGDPSWIQYDFGAGNKQQIWSYTLTTGNDVEKRDPKAWTLEASDDLATWQVVDTVTNGELPAARKEKKTFICDAPTSGTSRYYRLNVTERKVYAHDGDCGSKRCIQITEIELIGGVDASPAKAFDDNAGTIWATTDTPSVGAPVYLQFLFNNARKILKYTLTTGLYAEQSDPKTWTLEASNDGAAWTVVDTVENGALSATRGEQKTFICDAPPSVYYTYYRLNITAAKDNTFGVVQIAEVEMFEVVDA
ncbi:MAG: discoidin domain-containing protein, partial [Pseudomonadota bacterium]